jgi:hypothetical protein
MDPLLSAFQDALFNQSFSKYYINCGGCAKAAHEFYKYFKNIPEIKVKGAIVLNWCSYYQNKVSLTNMTHTSVYDKISYCNHVVLVFEYKNKQYVIDAADGIIPKDRYIAESSEEYHRNVITGYLKPRLLERLSKAKNDRWNTQFNPYHLKYLRKFLKGYSFYV